MPKKRPPSFSCPHCGAPVRGGRLACRECGSDLSTGWQDPEEIDYQQVDIPDTFEEMERLYDEGRRGGAGSPSALTPWQVVVVVATIVGMVLSLVWWLW